VSLGPFISCVMPTGRRPEFLAQAVRCFQRQRYPLRELIIVDDGPAAESPALPPDPDIRYLHLPRRTALGAKLNLGIEQAQGDVIQKLDDDDYYAPTFLERMVQGLTEARHCPAVAALDCFLVLIGRTGHLAFSGHGWLAGNSLCFQKGLWQKRAFRPLDRAEDWWFLRDHGRALVRVCSPELSIVVRHELGHTWTECGSTSVTDLFTRRAAHERPLPELVPEDTLAFYRSLMPTRVGEGQELVAGARLG
jgi:glycosyltransferase involved in cell wall biosynthesis